MADRQIDRVERGLIALLAAMVECGIPGDHIRAGWEKVARELGLKPGETICTMCGQRQHQERPADDILF